MKKTCWFVFQNGLLMLLRKNNDLPDGGDLIELEPFILRRQLVGYFNNTDYHCAEIELETPPIDALHAISLRQALSLFTQDVSSLAIKASCIINWDKNHRFCGRCSRETVHQPNTLQRLCTFCNLSFFPRISPSIIVLIKKGDHLLMARSPHFSPGVYGLIAGFIDAGENVEAAVHREVMEEVGLKIKNLSYWGSQPWPFPDSLMLGFTADYASGEILIDQNEIVEAGWYKYSDLPGLPSSTHSIAMKLIDEFVSCSMSNHSKN